jgi:hypothetical protein
MSFFIRKPARRSGAAPQTAPEALSQVENRFPRVLKGRPLKQLDIPQALVTTIAQNRVAQRGAAAQPSSLAELRIMLKGRKPQIG